MIRLAILTSCLWKILYAAFTCDPIQDCRNSAAGRYVPDPYNCEKFYVCVYFGSDLLPSDTSVSCKAGNYFDSTMICKPESSPGTCNIDYCASFATTTCHSDCTGNVEVVAYPGNCSMYYVCTPGNPKVFSCPENIPYFDGKECVADVNKCCNSCTPYCYSVGTEISDPYDCTRFYICATKGTVQEQFHVSCPAGKYFEPLEGKCISGTTCESAC